MKKLVTLIALLLMAFYTAGHAAESLNEVLVDVHRVGEYFEIKAFYQLPLSRCEAYGFITDYEGATAIPGIIASKVIERHDNVVKVQRVVEDHILFVPVKLRSVVQYTEYPENKISFQQLEGDALAYYGSWSLHHHDHVTDFRYEAKFKPNSAIPGFVIQYYIKNRIQQQFAAMANQAMRQTPKLMAMCSR